MIRFISFALSCALLAVSAGCSTTDPQDPPLRPPFTGDVLAEIAAEVEIDELLATVSDLESFQTRFVRAAGHDSAVTYLEDRVRTLGKTPARQTFTYRSGGIRESENVVVRLAGRDAGLVVLGAHFDAFQTFSFIDSLAPAPGADDNGTGVATVLEALRILRDFDFHHNLELVFFTAEEIGRFGSRHYVDELITGPDSLIGAVNVDMLGYDADAFLDAEVVYNIEASHVGAALLLAGDLFPGSTPIAYVPHIGGTPISDHLSFWEKNLPAAWIFEGFADWNMEIHTAGDRSDRLNEKFFLANARTVITAVASLAGPVSRPIAR